MAAGRFAHLGPPLLGALRRFLAGVGDVVGHTAELGRVIPCVKELQRMIEEDLLLEPENGARGRRSGKGVSFLTWRRRWYKANARCQSLAKNLELFKANTSHSIAWRWAVVAGLGDPTTSTRSVESWCREFAIAEEDKTPNLPHECCCNAGHIRPHIVRDEQAGCDEVCAERAARVRGHQASARRSVHALKIDVA